MSALLDRLSKLDAPDREVDAELEAVSLGGRVYLNDPESKEVIIERPIDGFWIRGIYPYRKIARYTASVDAVIALAEMVLPGCKVGLLPNFYRTFPYAGVIVEAGNPVDLKEAIIDGGATPAIALLIALLRAKEASNAE